MRLIFFMAERRHVPTPPVYPTTATISGFDSVFAFLEAGGAEASADDGEEDMMDAAVVAVVMAVEEKFLREMEREKALTVLEVYLKQDLVRRSNGSLVRVMFICYF